MTETIRLKDVSKSFKVTDTRTGFLGSLKSFVFPKYSTVYAVKNVNLTVNSGEIVGYIGPNGAGKSTTIKMIAGIMSPTSGHITVSGKDPFVNRVETQLSLGIMLGQRSRLFWDLPAIDSFRYFALVYRIEKNQIVKRIDETVEVFTLGSFINTPVRQLSLGQKMRCDIALNLLHRPSVLLLDEPTIGLDIEAKRAAREAIRATAREFGTSILLTSHDLGDVEKLSDRIVVLNQGRVLFSGTLSKLRELHKVKAQIRVTLQSVSDGLTTYLENTNGVTSVAIDDVTLEIAFDPTLITAAQVMSNVIKYGTIVDFKVSEPPIEELVESFYNFETPDLKLVEQAVEKV